MRKGFSLIEILISLALFAIFIMAFIPFFIVNLKHSTENLHREQAIYTADKLLNHLAALDFSNPCLSEGNHTCESDNGTCCGDLAGHENLSYEVIKESDNLKKIRVLSQFSGKGITIERLKGNW